jgi:hypothetical protein
MKDPGELWEVIEAAFRERCIFRPALLAELRVLPVDAKRDVARLIADRLGAQSGERP